MTGSCICGGVKVSVSRPPDFIHECNCGLCRKTGAGWGYFTSAEAKAQGDTRIFVRNDKEGAVTQVHSCTVCGATTHFDLSDDFKASNPTVDQIGINMKLFESSDLKGVEVRYPDGMNWSGEGSFSYRRSAMVIEETNPW